MRNRRTKLYEFYFKAGDALTTLCKVATDADVSYDDVALDELCKSGGVSGWNYVVCGQINMYRDREKGKFVKAVDALEFLVDRGNRRLALMVVEGVAVVGDALPRISGYVYAVPGGSDGDVDKGKDGGEAAPSASEGKVEEDVIKNEEVAEKDKVELGFIKADMMKMTKVELLELCMKHIDVKLWNENMRKAELVDLFF